MPGQLVMEAALAVPFFLAVVERGAPDEGLLPPGAWRVPALRLEPVESASHGFSSVGSHGTVVGRAGPRLSLSSSWLMSLIASLSEDSLCGSRGALGSLGVSQQGEEFMVILEKMRKKLDQLFAQESEG